MHELLRSTKAYKTIGADAKSGAAAHAMLVLFPDEKYLRPLLRECARAFFGAQAEGREGELISSETFADCLFLPAAGGKLTAADGARLVDESLLRPVEGNKKLFVLDAFHNASALVQNKLLKLLEEPPREVYFLLGAVSDFSVLPTVLSRVKRLEEPPFAEEAIAAALRRNHPAERGHAECAAACGGVYSAAEELLNAHGESFRLAERFLLTPNKEGFCRELGDGKEKEKRAFFSAVRLVLRDALFTASGQGKFASRKGEEVCAIAREYPAGALASALDLVTEAEKQIKFNANFGQCAEALAIEIAKEKEKWQRLS